MLRRSVGVWMAACLAAAGAVEGAGAPVADAVQASDRQALHALLVASADVNTAQVDGMTALHWAARHDDQEVAELLLEAGADASAANRYGVTPLTIACINGSGPVVKLLLDAGADPNTTLPGGETALMTASRTGRLAPVKALLVRGADPHATVLGMGRQEGVGANAFLRRMEDPTIFDFKLKSEQTALVWAASEGHAAVVAELIEFGADFRRKLESGFTPLLFAVRAGHLDVVKTLVDAGADVKQPIEPSKDWSHRGYIARLRPNATALHVAIENGHFGLADYLLEAGADPNAADRVGYTPLHAITNARRVALGDANPPPKPTGGMTSLDLVRKLAAHGADLNASLTGPGLLNLGTQVYGPTAFLAAAHTADLEFMRALVELGADPLLTDRNGNNALMLLGARTGSEAEVVEGIDMLLGLGIDIDALSKSGETAMHHAAYRDRSAPIELLAARGADISVWNRDNAFGSTPLALAAGYQGKRTIRPHPVAEAAIREVMVAAGVPVPEIVAVASQAKQAY